MHCRLCCRGCYGRRRPDKVVLVAYIPEGAVAPEEPPANVVRVHHAELKVPVQERKLFGGSGMEGSCHGVEGRRSNRHRCLNRCHDRCLRRKRRRCRGGWVGVELCAVLLEVPPLAQLAAVAQPVPWAGPLRVRAPEQVRVAQEAARGAPSRRHGQGRRRPHRGGVKMRSRSGAHCSERVCCEKSQKFRGCEPLKRNFFSFFLPKAKG